MLDMLHEYPSAATSGDLEEYLFSELVYAILSSVEV